MSTLDGDEKGFSGGVLIDLSFDKMNHELLSAKLNDQTLLDNSTLQLFIKSKTNDKSQ